MFSKSLNIYMYNVLIQEEPARCVHIKDHQKNVLVSVLMSVNLLIC